jgi:tRNA threonylcarbamoyl adenosine modification protein YeaZ
VVGLALETSSITGSLALFESAHGSVQILGTRDWNRLNSHAEHVTGQIENLLSEHRLTSKDLKILAVGLGPGSFTGVRVGINVARALAYSHNLEIYGIHSLRILAEQVRHLDGPILSLVNAYKNSVFAARFLRSGNVLQELEAPHVVGVSDLPQIISTRVHYVGDALLAYEIPAALRANLIESPETSPYPRAQDLAHIVGQDAVPDAKTVWENVKPLYIRASSAEENLERRK